MHGRASLKQRRPPHGLCYTFFAMAEDSPVHILSQSQITDVKFEPLNFGPEAWAPAHSNRRVHHRGGTRLHNRSATDRERNGRQKWTGDIGQEEHG